MEGMTLDIDDRDIVNYKLAGSGGFAPNIDSTAYTHVQNIKHLTILRIKHGVKWSWKLVCSVSIEMCS